MIRYYSTNRRLEGVAGLTPFKGHVSFRDALIQGQAPDEGLFMPEPIPALSIEDILALKGAPYAETALLVAEAFLKDELPREALKKIVEDSYNYDVPLERVFDRVYVMRLDRGPTASFKDFAARMMARLMSRLRDRGKRLNVLVATSGDTGSAVGEAFKGVPPDGNEVANNVCAGKWLNVYWHAQPAMLKLSNNLTNAEPYFVRAPSDSSRAVDFALKLDCPAFKTGFTAVPAEKIGLQDDEDRRNLKRLHEAVQKLP